VLSVNLHFAGFLVFDEKDGVFFVKKRDLLLSFYCPLLVAMEMLNGMIKHPD